MFAIVIAGASLVLSVVVAWRQHAAAGRATLTLQWLSSDQLLVQNHGPGQARSVRLEAGEETTRLLSAGHIAALGALQGHPVAIAQGVAGPDPTVTVSWQDNRRRRQVQTVELGESPPPQPHVPKYKAGTLDEAVSSLAQQQVSRALSELLRQTRARGRYTDL